MFSITAEWSSLDERPQQLVSIWAADRHHLFRTHRMRWEIFVQALRSFGAPSKGVGASLCTPATGYLIRVSPKGYLWVPMSGVSDHYRPRIPTQVVKCMVLNISHVGKHLRESDHGYSLGCEVLFGKIIKSQSLIWRGVIGVMEPNWGSRSSGN